MAVEAPGGALTESFVGGSLTSRRPVFSQNGKYLFLCVGHSVRVISVQTGATLHALEAHTANVTGVCLDAGNPLRIWSAGLDGNVCLWDYEDSVLLKTIAIGAPISRFLVSPTDPKMAFVVTSKGKGGAAAKQQGHMSKHKTDVCCKISLEATDNNAGRTKLMSCGAIKALTVTPDGKRLVAVSHSTMAVYDLVANQRYKVRHSHALTSAAVHPLGTCVATGDVTGRITLWYELDSALAKAAAAGTDELVGGGKRHKKAGGVAAGLGHIQVPTATLHWHAHPLADLQFTADGAYLISGGEEAVLVIWQLGNSHSPTYLPRLGAPIESLAIAADAKTLAVAHSDNAIRLVDSSTFQVTRVIRGLCMCGRASETLRGLAVANGKSGVVCVPAMPGAIQFYDVTREQHVADLAVSPHGYTSRAQANAPTNPSRVELIAFTPDGRCMATIERQAKAHGLAEESRLKFWFQDPNTQKYVLVTSAENPHGHHRVLSLTSHPTAPMFVTTGLDRRFKVWVPAEGQNEDTHTWRCRAVGFYRDEVPRACAFSGDGSLLAVGYDAIVTLWEPETNTLIQTLTCGGAGEADHVQQIVFVPGTPFMVVATQAGIFAWNLLTCSLWYSYWLPHPVLAAHPGIGKFVVVATVDEETPFAAVFSATSPLPEQVLALRSGDTRVRCAVYLDDAAASPMVVMATASGALKVLREQGAGDEAAAQAESHIDQSAAAKRAFDAIIGGEAGAKPAASGAALPQELGQRLPSQAVFVTAPHVQPPLHSLYDTFMSLLLANRAAARATNDMDVDDAESGSSDSGSDDEDADQVPESAPATKSPEPAAAVHVAGQSQSADDVIHEGEDFAFLATVFDQSLGGQSKGAKGSAHQSAKAPKVVLANGDAGDAMDEDGAEPAAKAPSSPRRSPRAPAAAPRSTKKNAIPKFALR